MESGAASAHMILLQAFIIGILYGEAGKCVHA